MGGGIWIRIGAISGALAVAAGAFGAHFLRERLDARELEVFETAARYQMYHALALLMVGVLGLVAKPGGTMLGVAGWSFLIGTVVFSGSLYTLALTGVPWLGAITPIGGLGFLIGWFALALVSLAPTLE